MKKLFLLAWVASFLFSTSSNAGEHFDLIFDHIEVSPDHTSSEHYDLIFTNCSVSNFHGDHNEFALDTMVDEYYEGRKDSFHFDQKIIVSFKAHDQRGYNGDYLYWDINAENKLINENKCSFRAEEGYMSDAPEVTIASCMQQFRNDPHMMSCSIKYENKEVGTVIFFVRIDRKTPAAQTVAKKTNSMQGMQGRGASQP